MNTTAELASTWRNRADELEPYAAPAAEAFRRAATELEDALQAAEDALLPPAEAARESGVSERTLRDHRQRGQLTDHGTAGRPLYRRGDLPRRARSAGGAWDPDAHVSGIVGAS